MRWTPGGQSSDIEDRRAGGGMGVRLGVGGTVLVVALSFLFGRNLFSDLGVTPGTGATSAQHQTLSPEDSAREELEVQFVSFVLDDAQRTWGQVLQQTGVNYHNAKLVLFRQGIQSGCGPAESAMGPFYCPADEKVYIDLGFYDELKTRFKAAGDFAQAYILTHEIGHHVQHLLGTDDKVRRLQQERPDLANELSVRLELQADCYAGVWGHSTQQRNLLEQGDVDEALNAASVVGDDRIQQQETGHVNVDSFTHGSAAQRSTWFKRGFDSGDLRACKTFSDE